MAHVFNTDLLLDAADREEAKRDYPDIFFALDNPALREVFAPIDRRANISKARSRRWGVCAVFLATAALLLAGGELLYHELPKNQVRLIAALGGVAGIVSVVIGVFGIMYHGRKMRWLADRLATERMRQFHFQYYVMNAKDILKGAKDSKAAELFANKRVDRFNRFAEEFLNHVDELLHHLVRAEDSGEGVIIEEASGAVDANDPHLQQYFRAYARLRFDRQFSYCNHVLRESKGFWKLAPIRQVQILGAIALACVFGILLLHGLVFLGAVTDIEWMKGPLVHVFAIWAAITAMTARTFEEGFQPDREIERLRQYRVSLRRIHARFHGAETPDIKIAAMQELERLTYQEMTLFLRSSYEAQFVM